MHPKTIYYPDFDYLRIALAIVVMLYHDDVIQWHQSGSLAVQVFFALSGWLIGGILLNLAPKDLPRFYFNRALRIWIPYYIALGLLIGASLLHDGVNIKWTEFVFYKLSFVYNLFGTSQLAQYGQQMPLQGTGNHFWSVNAEEQFYLLAPLLLVVSASRLGRTVLLWSAIAIAAWISHNGYSSIVFGVLAAIVANRYGPIHSRPSIRYALLGITLAALLGILANLDYDRLAPIFAVGVVLLLAMPGERNRLGPFLGGMSYPLYLNHWIGVFVGNLCLAPLNLQHSVYRHGLSVVINLAIAAGLYWWVDRWILLVRGKLFSLRLGRMAIVAAYSLAVVGLAGGLIFALRAGTIAMP